MSQVRYWMHVLGVSFVLQYLIEWTLDTIGFPSWIILVAAAAAGFGVGWWFGTVRVRTERHVRLYGQNHGSTGP